MAMLIEASGLIRDRSRGYRELSYRVPAQSKSFMRACKKAHELILRLLPQEKRISITAKELRQSVLLYVALDEQGKRKLISRLALPIEEQKPAAHTLAELFELWKKGKIAENGNGEKLIKTINQHERVLFDFFNDRFLKTVCDLAVPTAHDFIAWRSKKSYGNSKAISASTVKKEIFVLRQLAKLAAMHGWIPNGGIWDSVKVKAVAGKNKKIVEPLTVDEQKNLLKELRHKSEANHDVALFFLTTGIRLGELEAIKPDGIGNGIITLHGNHIGKIKTTGKTSSASRNLPVCPTISKIVERGHIFKTSANALRLVLSRHFPGVHPHRLRHTFAVNKLLAQTPLQMVSYQMGHSGTGITADLYGKFVPEHFKAGFEETIRIRKEHLDWLENRYFSV